MTAEMNEAQTSEKGLLRRLAPLGVLVAAAAIILSQGWHNYLTLEQLAANREFLKTFIAENAFVALMAYIVIYTVVIALSLPGGALLTVAGGFLFGWMVGAPATVVAATVGATIIFLVAKTSFGEPLAARAGPWLEKLRKGFQDNALSYLLFLRLVPAFPFWLVNLAPALLGVNLRTYVVGTFLGIIPGTFAYTYAGVGLGSVIDAQQKVYDGCVSQHSGSGPPDCQFALDAGALITPELLIAFTALGVVALIPAVIKKLRK